MEEDTKNNSQTVVEDENQSQLEKCLVDLQQWKDSALRMSADFENFKRRTVKERANWVEDARADVLGDLLTIVDNFDRAFEQSQAIDGDPKLAVWLQGFAMIRKSLYDLLARYEVKVMPDNLPFDPQYHEAIAQVPSEKVASGQIVETVQKGFLVKDRVLRVARVVVAN